MAHQQTNAVVRAQVLSSTPPATSSQISFPEGLHTCWFTGTTWLATDFSERLMKECAGSAQMQCLKESQMKGIYEGQSNPHI